MSFTENAGLSGRERETLQLASRGLIDKEIATRMGVSFSTIRTYWRRIREKLGSTNRSASIAMYVRGRRSQRTNLEECVMAVMEAEAAVLVVGAEDEVVHASDRAHDFLGYEKGALPGTKLRKVIPSRFKKFYMDVAKLQTGAEDCEGWCTTMALYAKRGDGADLRVQATLGYCQQETERLIVVYLVNYAEELSLRKRSASTIGEFGMPRMAESVRAGD